MGRKENSLKHSAEGWAAPVLNVTGQLIKIIYQHINGPSVDMNHLEMVSDRKFNANSAMLHVDQKTVE